MEVQYRRAFLKELKKLKGQPVYDKVFELAFTKLPAADGLKDIANVKAMRGYAHRFRIRVGSYRVGIEVHGHHVEVMCVLHRREFYRYFP